MFPIAHLTPRCIHVLIAKYKRGMCKRGGDVISLYSSWHCVMWSVKITQRKAAKCCLTIRGWRRSVGTNLVMVFCNMNVSGYRCVSDCRSRGRDFDPGPVPYFFGDWSWYNFYGHQACPGKSVVRWTDRPVMTLAVDWGRKATKQTNKQKPWYNVFKSCYSDMYTLWLHRFVHWKHVKINTFWFSPNKTTWGQYFSKLYILLPFTSM